MIQITITGEPTGKRALLYELRKRQGARKFVPTYHAYAECHWTGKRFEFSVVRDPSAHIFGPRPLDPYGENGECPPSSDVPYSGTILEDGPIGFRIQLTEAGCEQEEWLVGIGSTIRKRVWIHFGACASFGCILIAGRRRSYKVVFERPLRTMLAHCATTTISVVVLPRDMHNE